MQLGQDFSSQLPLENGDSKAILTDFHEFEETIVNSNIDQIAWTKDGLYSIF